MNALVETLKNSPSLAGHFIAPDFWAVGAVLRLDEDSTLRLEGQCADYAIHTVRVTSRFVDFKALNGAGAVRVAITYCKDDMTAGKTRGGWMAVGKV